MLALSPVAFINIHEHIKKKSICKIKTCKEINGRTIVLLYRHTQIIEMSTQIIVIYKYNGVRRTKWVEFGRGYFFILLYTKNFVYRRRSISKNFNRKYFLY